MAQRIDFREGRICLFAVVVLCSALAGRRSQDLKFSVDFNPFCKASVNVAFCGQMLIKLGPVRIDLSYIQLYIHWVCQRNGSEVVPPPSFPR